MNNYKNTYNLSWQDLRINYIKSKFSPQFFNEKSILELAPYNGYIGNSFYELGAKVTCIEGRKENCQHIKTHFPHLIVHQANLDTVEWKWGNFDIIINMGLLYHLENNHKQHLENCIHNSKILILETVINSDKTEIISYRPEEGADQSLSQRGGEPSIKWIENILRKNTHHFTRANDIGNAGEHHYDGCGSPGYNRALWITINKL